MKLVKVEAHWKLNTQIVFFTIIMILRTKNYQN